MQGLQVLVPCTGWFLLFAVCVLTWKNKKKEDDEELIHIMPVDKSLLCLVHKCTLAMFNIFVSFCPIKLPLTCCVIMAVA